MNVPKNEENPFPGVKIKKPTIKIIKEIKIKIIEQEVLRYLGYQKNLISKINLDIKRIINKEITQIYSLMNGKGIYRFMKISSISQNGIMLIDHRYRFLVNRKIIDLLDNAEYLVLAVVTIGPEIEKAVQERFAKNLYVRAMALDAAGTVAVKTVGQWLNHFIEQGSFLEGHKLTRYFEPGSGDWDIGEQKKIFQILKPEKIGVTLNDSCMMHPGKSLSWIRGMGANVVYSCREEFSCKYCMLDHCQFQKK